jgi:hypothetical protein
VRNREEKRTARQQQQQQLQQQQQQQQQEATAAIQAAMELIQVIDLEEQQLRAANPGNPGLQLPSARRRERKSARKFLFRQRGKRQWIDGRGSNIPRPVLSNAGVEGIWGRDWCQQQLQVHLNHEQADQFQEAAGGQNILPLQRLYNAKAKDFIIWREIFQLDGLHHVDRAPTIAQIRDAQCPRIWFAGVLTTDGVSGRWHQDKKVPRQADDGAGVV